MLKSDGRMYTASLAEQIGLRAACVLQQIFFWLLIKGKKDGDLVWARPRNIELLEQLPFISSAQFYRVVNHLRSLGILHIRNKTARGIEYSIDHQNNILLKFPLVRPNGLSHNEKTYSHNEKTYSQNDSEFSHNESHYIKKAKKAKKSSSEREASRQVREQAKEWYNQQSTEEQKLIDDYVTDYMRQNDSWITDPNIFRWHRVADIMNGQVSEMELEFSSEEFLERKHNEMFGPNNISFHNE